ncbi:unnamed protein product [Adineta ricciae]|uniref:Uncharacterized protein n=2 Tax=Adineta ricciae TaxID=249248 RepID=A0A814RUB6_ADIRI|nr:unnamed protein product [Adineta ricciae]
MINREHRMILSHSRCQQYRNGKFFRNLCFATVVILLMVATIICTPIFIKKLKGVEVATLVTITPTTTTVMKRELTTPPSASISSSTTTRRTTQSITKTATKEDAIRRRWTQNGTTVAGENGQGNRLNQLNNPSRIRIDVDDDQIMYILDRNNHRVVRWKQGEQEGEVVAGGNGIGSQLHQLNLPTDLIVEKSSNSLLICDYKNKRVIRWFIRNKTNVQQQIILSNFDCSSLAMDVDGNMYVSDHRKREIKRWRKGDTNGTVVANGNGLGDQSNERFPLIPIFIDGNHSVYAVDNYNHRILKWTKYAKEAIVVAGGHGRGDSLSQLAVPSELYVDYHGNIYLADEWNYRIVRWLNGAKEGSVIAGGNRQGRAPNQLNLPSSVAFDRQGNLYVADSGNHRIQRFDVINH